MSEINSDRNPLAEPIMLTLSDHDLLTILRGGQIDVRELNIRIAVGGSGARQNWNLRRKLEFISRHRTPPKKEQATP